ncbi:hypothetical protein A3Q56_06673, partial [Intoshia linei]
MEQHVINSIKLKYFNTLIKRIMENDKIEENLKKINILDVTMLQDSWECVTENEIKKSWKLLGIGQENNIDYENEITSSSTLSILCMILLTGNDTSDSIDDINTEPDTELIHIPYSNDTEDFDLAIKKVGSLIQINSNVNAIICIILTLYNLKHSFTDKVYYTHTIVQINISSYCFIDLCIVVYNFSHFQDIKTIIHHIIAVFGIIYIMNMHLDHWLIFGINLRILTEISTPFINNRWFLIHTGFNNSKFQFING